LTIAQQALACVVLYVEKQKGIRNQKNPLEKCKKKPVRDPQALSFFLMLSSLALKF
jgi:hypothetical protein